MNTRQVLIMTGLFTLIGGTRLMAAEYQPLTKESPALVPEKVQKPTALQEAFSQSVEQYVRAESQKTGGAFVVHDDELDKDWRLNLVRIHKDRIVPLSGDRFFACADFIETKAPKKGVAKHSLDLDFYVRKADKTGSGWWVEEVLVHKVNGHPRYTYDSNNQRVPVMN